MLSKIRLVFPYYFWIWVAIGVLLNLLFCGWLSFVPHTQRWFALGCDFFHTTDCFLGTLISFFGAFQLFRHRFFSRSVQTWIPLLFGLGFLDDCFAWIFNIWDDLHNYQGILSWGDVCFVTAMPLFLIGILLLPVHRISHIKRSRIVVDCCIIMLSLITFSWYFILGPRLLEGSDSLLTKIVESYYPIFDLILIFCIVLFSFRSIHERIRPTIILLSLGFLATAITDSIFAFQTLDNTNSSSWIDIGWSIGDILMQLGILALCVREIPPSRSEANETSSSLSVWRSMIPFVLLPIIIAFSIFILTTQEQGTLANGVYICGILLILLLVFRQVLAVREVLFLNYALRDSRHRLFEKNDELALMNQRLEALATTDPLTELLNHRAMVSHLDLELARCERYHHSCSLLFIDIDHFKVLNDSYGHPAGDLVLCEFANLLRSCMRPLDVVGRWGGEEFIALLPELTTADALSLAELFQVTVAKHNFPVGGGLHFTCSIGLACFPDHAQQRDTLIKTADQAMYVAKHLGRNQIRTADDPLVLSLLTEEITAQNRDESSRAGTVEALFALLERRDPSTAIHSQRVAELLLQLSLSLHMSQLEARNISLAGLLHDLGKITIPDTILHKNAPLNDTERSQMQLHPQIGASVVSRIPALHYLAPIIEAHHERWDGLGYPHGLRDVEIPQAARLLAVVDAYDVITHARIYQEAQSPEEAQKILELQAGSQFDLDAVQALIRLLHCSDSTILKRVAV